MDWSIVHQNDNLLQFGCPVDPKFVKRSVQKVIEDYVVSASLRNLGRNDAVESHCCNHWEWVSRLLLRTFCSLQKGHLNWQTLGPGLCSFGGRKLLSFVFHMPTHLSSRVFNPMLFRSWIITYFGKSVNQILTDSNFAQPWDVCKPRRSTYSTTES